LTASRNPLSLLKESPSVIGPSRLAAGVECLVTEIELVLPEYLLDILVGALAEALEGEEPDKPLRRADSSSQVS